MKSVQIRTRNNSVFGHFSRSGVVDEEEFIKGFLRYLTLDEHSVIQEALKGESKDVYQMSLLR